MTGWDGGPEGRICQALNVASSLRELVDDLITADLELLGWSGDTPHVRAVAEALDPRETGEVEYLTVRAAGLPVATLGVDYADDPESGLRWQLVTHPQFEGRGLATALIGAAEDRIRARGRPRAHIGAEVGHVRAEALYARLGYVQQGAVESGR